jgi:hypothetical protein
MMKRVKLGIVLWVALLLVCQFSPVYADGVPALPLAFYGCLTINGYPAPAGMVVEARGTGVRTGIEGNPLTTTDSGIYGSFNGLGEKLLVQGNIDEGAILHFYINGQEADQTAVWKSGMVTRLDLNLTGATSDVSLSTILQGSYRPDSGWAVPLTVKFFFTSGNNTPVDVMNASPARSFNLTTVKNEGKAVALASAINPGIYDITVVSPHCLVNVKRGVAVEVPSTLVNMGTLLEGNANDDYKVNINDFGLLAKTYGRSSNDAGFDARADFDRSGKINITDFGLLASNYGKYAPVEVH